MSASRFGTMTPVHSKPYFVVVVATSVPWRLAVKLAASVASLNVTGSMGVMRPVVHFGRIKFWEAAVSMMAEVVWPFTCSTMDGTLVFANVVIRAAPWRLGRPRRLPPNSKIGVGRRTTVVLAGR